MEKKEVVEVTRVDGRRIQYRVTDRSKRIDTVTVHACSPESAAKKGTGVGGFLRRMVK